VLLAIPLCWQRTIDRVTMHSHHHVHHAGLKPAHTTGDMHDRNNSLPATHQAAREQDIATTTTVHPDDCSNAASLHMSTNLQRPTCCHHSIESHDQIAANTANTWHVIANTVRERKDGSSAPLGLRLLLNQPPMNLGGSDMFPRDHGQAAVSKQASLS
jgi:hypothetical protein